MKSHQSPRTCSIQLPLVSDRHIIPAGKCIRDPRRAHRVQPVAIRAQDGRAQRLVFGLLDALSELSVILDGYPAVFVEDVCEAFAFVREERDGRVDVFGHVHHDEESVLGVDGAEVAVVAVLLAASVASTAVDQRRGLRCLRDLRFGGPFEVGFVDVHADYHAYLEFGFEEWEVLTV